MDLWYFKQILSKHKIKYHRLGKQLLAMHIYIYIYLYADAVFDSHKKYFNPPQLIFKTDNFKIQTTIQTGYAEVCILQMPRTTTKLILSYENHTLECKYKTTSVVEKPQINIQHC